MLALAIVAAAGGRDLSRNSAVFLAVPHLSLALGLAFLIMPTGLLARLLALPFGWTLATAMGDDAGTRGA